MTFYNPQRTLYFTITNPEKITKSDNRQSKINERLQSSTLIGTVQVHNYSVNRHLEINLYCAFVGCYSFFQNVLTFQ